MSCVPIVNRENLLEQAKLGRIATHSPSAEARRSDTQNQAVRCDTELESFGAPELAEREDL